MFNLKVSLGSKCQFPEGGCTISLYPNNASNLVSTDKYILVSGAAELGYDGLYETIQSPYTAVDQWQDYVDSWTYDVRTSIKVKPNTEFLQINSGEPPFSAKIITLNNSSTTFAAKNLSAISIFANANTFSINGEAISHPNGENVYNKNVLADGDITIQATELCKVVYIEKV